MCGGKWFGDSGRTHSSSVAAGRSSYFSLTWPLCALAGAPKPILSRWSRSQRTPVRMGEDTRQPGFRAVSCPQQWASFLLFVATLFYCFQEAHTGSLPPRGGQPSWCLPSRGCHRREAGVQECQAGQPPVLSPDRFPTSRGVSWLGMHGGFYSPLACSQGALGPILQSD